MSITSQCLLYLLSCKVCNIYSNTALSSSVPSATLIMWFFQLNLTNTYEMHRYSLLLTQKNIGSA